jgi:hypothetical protein
MNIIQDLVGGFEFVLCSDSYIGWVLILTGSYGLSIIHDVCVFSGVSDRE